MTTQLEFLSNYLKQTIDFDDEKLLNNPEYKELVIYLKEGAVNLNYFREKYILTQDQIKKKKLGCYDINTTNVPIGAKVDYEDLIKELYEELVKERDLEFAKNPRQECGEIVDKGNVRERLVRKDGIRVQLKKHLKLDLSLYKDNTDEKIARNKLLKLLYKLLKSKKPGKGSRGKNLTLLLSKPTLENVDNSVIGYDTINGRIINDIKSEVMKELSPDFIRAVKKVVHDTVVIPENILNILMEMMDGINTDQWLFEQFLLIEKLLKELILDAKKLVISNQNQKIHTLFGKFYLKMIQSENIAREEDLITLNWWLLNLKWDNVDLLSFYNYQTDEEIKGETNLRVFVEKNIEIIAMCVYHNDGPNEEQKQEILNGLKCYEKIFELLKRTTKYGFCVSLDCVVACIQTYLKCKREGLEYINKYYGSDVNPKSLLAVLKSDGRDQEAYEICWTNMVYYKYYINFGYSKAYSKFKNLEILFSELTISVLGIASTFDIEQFNHWSRIAWLNNLRDIFDEPFFMDI